MANEGVLRGLSLAMTIQNATGHGGGGARLPKEYKEVQYIESTGDEFINTLYVPKSYSGFEIDMYLLENENALWPTPFGSRNEGNNTSISSASILWHTFWAQEARHTNTACFGMEYVDSVTISIVEERVVTCLTQRHFSIKDKDGQSIRSFAFDGNQVNGTYPIYLFTLDEAGHDYGDVTHCIMRLYSFKIYEQLTMVRNFVPCYRKSDDEPGVYDLFTGTFATNIGSGEFIVGPEV